LVIYPLYHLEEVPKEATSLADIAGYSIIKIVAQPNLRQSKYGIDSWKAEV
jgi:hypothetical protein